MLRHRFELHQKCFMPFTIRAGFHSSTRIKLKSCGIGTEASLSFMALTVLHEQNDVELT